MSQHFEKVAATCPFWSLFIASRFGSPQPTRLSGGYSRPYGFKQCRVELAGWGVLELTTVCYGRSKDLAECF
jgi:hypothetical protein